jgi:hypothetical protein
MKFTAACSLTTFFVVLYVAGALFALSGAYHYGGQHLFTLVLGVILMANAVLALTAKL